MSNTISGNFSEFLQTLFSNGSNREREDILILLKNEFDGILKQISMLIKTYNSVIDYDVLKSKFYTVLKNSSTNVLISNQYNLYYQEIFSKIIKDGDYALKSNRYAASQERIELLQSTLSKYKKNMDMSDDKISKTLNSQIKDFVDRSIVSNLLSCMEDECFDLPCKQNEMIYEESTKLINRTKDVMIANIEEVCNKNIGILKKYTLSYLENKIKEEQGYTASSLTLSQLQQARQVITDDNTVKS